MDDEGGFEDEDEDEDEAQRRRIFTEGNEGNEELVVS